MNLIISPTPLSADSHLEDPLVRQTAEELHSAISSNDLSEVERLVEQIKAAPHLSAVLTDFNYISNGYLGSPLVLALGDSNQIVAIDQSEVNFQIRMAHTLLNGYEHYEISALAPNLIKSLAELELQIMDPLFDFDNHDLEKIHVLINRIIDHEASLLSNSPYADRVQILNERLIAAVKMGAPELVRALLRHGADHSITDDLGYSLSQMACSEAPRVFFNRIGEVTGTLADIESTRLRTLRSLLETHFSRLAVVFAWKERQDEAADETHIGKLPLDILKLITRNLLLDEINWPLPLTAVQSVRSAIHRSWGVTESKRRLSEIDSPRDLENIAPNSPKRPRRETL